MVSLIAATTTDPSGPLLGGSVFAWVALVVTVLGVGAGGGVLGRKLKWFEVKQVAEANERSGEHLLIDQLQEEKESERKRHADELARRDAEHSQQLTGVRDDLAKVQRANVALWNHVNNLHTWIAGGAEPPAPAMPEGLFG